MSQSKDPVVIPPPLGRGRVIRGKERYAIYKPIGNAIVGQRSLPFMGNYYLVEDKTIDPVEWIFQFSIENGSDTERKHTKTTELGMRVTEGHEVDTSISASGSYSGFGFSFSLEGNVTSKELSTVETNSVTTVTDEYTVPPRSELWVYKKRYNFRGRAWLYHQSTDARIVRGSGPLEGTYALGIIADQELDHSEDLGARQGEMTVDKPTGLIQPSKTENLADLDEAGNLAIWLSIAYPWLLQ